MRVKILGKYWNLRFVPNLGPITDGDCTEPNAKGREIRIRSGLRGTEYLETVIHEAMHAGDWHKSEEYVTQFSHDLARLLRHKSIWERIDG